MLAGVPFIPVCLFAKQAAICHSDFIACFPLLFIAVVRSVANYPTCASLLRVAQIRRCFDTELLAATSL